MPGEITREMSNKERRLSLTRLEIKCSNGASITIAWGAKRVFGAYSNELHEIKLLESWDITGWFRVGLLLKDLKRQPLQGSLSNLIRFYPELD